MNPQTSLYRSPRGSCRLRLCLALVLCLAPAAVPVPVQAACPARAGAAAAAPAPFAFLGGILGNRTRMIQVATLGMAIAIFILTRGHNKY